MARRKSVCVKWTLILMLVLFSSFVYSRPQESSSSITTDFSIEKTEASAENVIRYNEKYNINYRPLSVISKTFVDENYPTNRFLNFSLAKDYLVNNISIAPKVGTKESRSILLNNIKSRNLKTSVSKSNKLVPVNTYDNKPVIKKVFTKWTDKAKYEDLKFSNELKTSYDSNTYPNSDEYISSTEDNIRPTIKYQYNVPNNKVNYHHKPKPHYSPETQVYSNNVQIYDNYPHSFTNPSYMFSTPTPTPIITNVGYPKPWSDSNSHVNIKPTTRKPVRSTRPKYPYNHNIIHNHSPQVGNNFEVSTVKSHPSYTDKIVIRPEEYNASPYDCPTIFLSLNNTFQGEGKEVCPDLNIAVNTNVINKNNVIETEEETDTTLTDIFGLPFGESDSEETANINESTESYENQDQIEDASIEGQSLANYNAVNEVSDELSIDSSNLGQQYTAISRPKRPGKKKKDTFGLSSIMNFFQPVMKGFSWLAAINPLSFSAVSLILTPVILLVAGFSAFATVFTPWAFSYARDASIDPNSPPQWQWDDYYKTWHWNSFLDNRKLRPEEEKRTAVGEEVKYPTCLGWLDNINDLLRRVIEKIKGFSEATVIRKRRRRKTDTWAFRVK